MPYEEAPTLSRLTIFHEKESPVMLKVVWFEFLECESVRRLKLARPLSNSITNKERK